MDPMVLRPAGTMIVVAMHASGKYGRGKSGLPGLRVAQGQIGANRADRRPSRGQIILLEAGQVLGPAGRGWVVLLAVVSVRGRLVRDSLVAVRLV